MVTQRNVCYIKQTLKVEWLIWHRSLQTCFPFTELYVTLYYRSAFMPCFKCHAPSNVTLQQFVQISYFSTDFAWTFMCPDILITIFPTRLEGHKNYSWEVPVKNRPVWSEKSFSLLLSVWIIRYATVLQLFFSVSKLVSIVHQNQDNFPLWLSTEGITDKSQTFD